MAAEAFPKSWFYTEFFLSFEWIVWAYIIVHQFNWIETKIYDWYFQRWKSISLLGEFEYKDMG